MRARRHGTQNSSAASGGAADGDGEARYFHSMPARSSIIAVTPATTSAVPRSGCFTISSMKTHRHHGGAQQGVAPVLHLVEARGEEPGEKKNDDGLGDLRGLEGEAAETDPAMGVVRVAKEEDHDQQQGGDGERGKMKRGEL